MSLPGWPSGRSSFERELLLKRNEGRGAGSEGPVASSRHRVILELEEQTLRAQVTHADKKIEVATLEKQVVERLLKILWHAGGWSSADDHDVAHTRTRLWRP